MHRWQFLIVFAILGMGTLASADPGVRPPPKPPSTGKELATDPIVLPAEAQANVARAAIKQGDCTGHVAALSTALSLAGDKLSTDERIAASVLLQKCAKASKSWHALSQASLQGTLVQVKALFDELKAHGVTYVEDPRIFDERGAVQRTRLPAEVLASTNAQCLEGTLMYASLMEAIGLQPVLIFKKGHAFIAWKPSKYDRTKLPLFFLETTLTGGPATFEQAMESATRTFIEAAQEKQFELGAGALIDVAALRAKGYTAQPY